MLNFIKKTKIISGCIFGVIVTLCCVGVVVVGSSKNASAIVDTIVGELDTSCTILSSTTNPAHTADVTPGSTVTNIGNTSVNVYCNNSDGFSVFAVGTSGNIEGNTVMSHRTESSAVIATGTATSGNTSSWAMKVTPASGRSEITSENSYNNYKAVPSSWTKVVKRAAGVEVGTSSAFSVTYQVFASATQTAGAYDGQVSFTVADPSTEECPEGYTMEGGVCKKIVFGGITNMQQMTTAICSAASIGDSKQLIDTRSGNESYLVAKLADGNCWMLDNLRLGGTSTISLTASDTNIASDYTLPASGTANFDYINGYMSASINTASKDTTTTSYGNGSGKIGTYYSYCAATAGTYCYSSGSGSGNAQYDICPKGWRMPTGGSSGEYQALYTAYSSNASSFLSALSIPLSGCFSDGSANDQGSYGYFWSSTYKSSSSRYDLVVGPSSVSPTLSNYRYSGNSMRCLSQ